MMIEINEEEREFLERMTHRAEVMALMNIGQRKFERDIEKLRALKHKFREPDLQLIQKSVSNDN